MSENETFPVCVELTAGALERNITVPLLVGDGSAVGEFSHACIMINVLQVIFDNYHNVTMLGFVDPYLSPFIIFHNYFFPINECV